MNRLVRRIVREQENGLTDTLSGTEFGKLMPNTKGVWSVESDGSLILTIDKNTETKLFKIV
jgi:hypothetical protein